jgi:membrane protein YdbS with pleckstrin-like domain
MSRRGLWREGEVRIIAVTPVSRGVIRPALLTLTTLLLVVEGSARFYYVHRFEEALLIVAVLPLALLALTRTWQWRSHKIHVTSQRVTIEGGILRHWESNVEMRDVLSTKIDQSVTERLTRRGYVYLETAAATIPVGLVRHPGALCRMIDAERSAQSFSGDPLDTVYTYHDPDASPYEVLPDQWQRRRYE